MEHFFFSYVIIEIVRDSLIRSLFLSVLEALFLWDIMIKYDTRDLSEKQLALLI